MEPVQLEQGVQLLPGIPRCGKVGENRDGRLGFPRFEEEGDDLGAQGGIFGKGGEECVPFGEGCGILLQEPVQGGLAQADGDGLVVVGREQGDETGVEGKGFGGSLLLVGDPGERFEGGNAVGGFLQHGFVERAGFVGLVVFAEKMSIDQPGDGGPRGAGVLEVLQKQGGLVFFAVEIPQQIEDVSVGGILLEELDVVIRQAGVGRGPGRGEP